MRRRLNNRNNPPNPNPNPLQAPRPPPVHPQQHPRHQQQHYNQSPQQPRFQHPQQLYPNNQQLPHHQSPQRRQQPFYYQNRQQPHHQNQQHHQQPQQQYPQQQPPQQQRPQQQHPQQQHLQQQHLQQQHPQHQHPQQQHLQQQHPQQQHPQQQHPQQQHPQQQHPQQQHPQQQHPQQQHPQQQYPLQQRPQEQHPQEQHPQQQPPQQQYLQQPDSVMANLNFQQAPRSLASGGVGARGLVSGVSGHVTPTFGGALSPGRGSSVMPGGAPPSMASRSTLFGQRAFTERRVPMPTTLSQPNSNSMSSMGNLTRFNAGNNYHSVFGEGGDTSTPPLLDLSEFPSLTARGAGDQAPAAAPPPPGSKPYVGMVKQPTSEQSEFTMSSEDFPALPGTSSTGGAAVGPPGPAHHPHAEYTAHPAHPAHPAHALAQDKPRKGIQTEPDGKVTNIPETMIPNQFGIVGLLTFIRAAESDPSLVSLALGQDLTALGLNLNSPDNLYLTFAGPWADTPCRPQDMDYHVPPEYLINGSIREKLAPLRLNRYKEDLLFYLFYCFVGDVLQIAAAAELYNREWRYHMEEKVWISQAPGMPMVEKTSTYERGTYYFFDAHNWRKVAKEFHLDYSKLEGRPQLPPHVLT